MRYSSRQKLGAIAYDLLRFVWALRLAKPRDPGAAEWVYFCNRNERHMADPKHQGAACNWQWTSDLHIATVVPVQAYD